MLYQRWIMYMSVSALVALGSSSVLNVSTLLPWAAPCTMWAFVMLNGMALAAKPTSKRCPYEVLGVKRTDTKATIKKAYRKKSKQYHPDVNSSAGAEDEFKEVAYAYEVLSDDNWRHIYDTEGHSGLERAANEGEGGSPFDFFTDLFGGGRRRPREKQKAPSTAMKLRLSLEQLYFGDTLQVSFTRPVLCRKADECYRNRNDCQGPGIRVTTQQMAPGFIVQNQVSDDSCIDSGKAWIPKCKACPNGMTQMETSNHTLYVEKGMKQNDRIVFEGAGEQKIGHEAGDLVFVVYQGQSSPTFERVEDNLKVVFHVPLKDALVGFSRMLKHIDGKEVEVKKSNVTHDGEKMTLKGKGMPIKGRGKYGDLVVLLRVDFPTYLDDRRKKLIEEALSGVPTAARESALHASR